MRSSSSMKEKFPTPVLDTIIEQALVYQCACPAQVAELLLELRRVERYEQKCLEDEQSHLALTHRTIAASVAEAHAILEQCLDEVLTIEQWDRTTWKMPEGLRKE